MLPPPPPELARFFLLFDWENERLWRLELPVETMPTYELRWHLALPWWNGPDGPFTVRPVDVLADPASHPQQYARTLNTDLRWPLHVTRNDGRWTIMDGMHRLLKAVMLEREHMQVRKVPRSAYERIRPAA